MPNETHSAAHALPLRKALESGCSGAGRAAGRRLCSLRDAVTVGALLLAVPAFAQFREYYVYGKVTDARKEPIAEVQVELRDPSSSTTFHMKTDKKGIYKFAGLPHATYKVTFSKDGYEEKKDDWDFGAKQDTMKRVEVQDVVLVTQTQVQETQRLQAVEAGSKEAQEKIRQGDLDGALALLQGVLKKSPDDANALFFLGLSYAGKKMYGDAIPPLTRVTELSPDFSGAWFELGVCHRGLDEMEEALEAFDKCLERDPTNADAAYDAGLILFETNRIAEALGRFQNGLTSKPDDPQLNEMAGRCYLHDQKLEEAVAHFEKARAGTTEPDRQAFLDELIRSTRALIH
jgi:tetratricopeptide (TPR) repeat protein